MLGMQSILTPSPTLLDNLTDLLTDWLTDLLTD